MNLNKYTKAELISKFKKLDVKNENINSNLNKNSILSQIKSYFSQIWELMLAFKNILVKLTLVSLLIQIFKKYKILRKIWTVLNTIVLSIFGLSLLENSLMEFIQGIFTETRFITVNILDYFVNTNLFQYLSKLFYNKDEIKVDEVTHIQDSVKTDKTINNLHRRTSSKHEWTPSDKRYYSQKDDSLRKSYKSKLADWINWTNDTNEVQTEIQPESNSNYKKYLIIGGIVISGILVWYYADEAKTAGAGLIDWMNSFRTGERDGNSNSSNSSNKSSIKLSNPNDTKLMIASGVSSPEIDSLDKGKGKLLTSSSVENLSEKAKEEWGESLDSYNGSSSTSSSSSSSSTKTVRPIDSSTKPLFKEKMDNFIISSIRGRWKSFLPDNLKNIMNSIENKVNESSRMDSNIADELLKQLVELNKDNNAYETVITQETKSDLSQLHQKEVNTQIKNWIEETRDKIINKWIK